MAGRPDNQVHGPVSRCGHPVLKMAKCIGKPQACPNVVGHCVFGLFIFKGGQINLYPEASSCLPWLATFLRNSHLVWMPQTSFTLSIWTLSFQRGWASWRLPRNPWGSLPPTPPLTPAPPLWADIPSIGSAVCIIISFQLPSETPSKPHILSLMS